MLPGAFDLTVADAETWFEREVDGLINWPFDETACRRITQPALSVLGGGSDALWPRFGETHRLLLENLPDAISTVKGFWLNPVSRILLVVVLSNPGSTLGTFIGGSWIAGRSLS